MARSSSDGRCDVPFPDSRLIWLEGEGGGAEQGAVLPYEEACPRCRACGWVAFRDPELTDIGDLGTALVAQCVGTPRAGRYRRSRSNATATSSTEVTERRVAVRIDNSSAHQIAWPTLGRIRRGGFRGAVRPYPVVTGSTPLSCSRFPLRHGAAGHWAQSAEWPERALAPAQERLLMTCSTFDRCLDREGQSTGTRCVTRQRAIFRSEGARRN